MNKHEKCFNGLMKEMYEVPGVEEHMNKFEFQMSKKIMLRRAELGLSQNELADLIKSNGEKIRQKTISKVESGEYIIESETYEKILKALEIS